MSKELRMDNGDVEDMNEETKLSVIRRNAFAAGFMAAGEGFNGEYIPADSSYDTPKDAAIAKAEEYEAKISKATEDTLAEKIRTVREANGDDLTKLDELDEENDG